MLNITLLSSPISRVLLSSLDMREGPHLFCSVILGRCLACAFELGPHVFPFIPSAGTAQSFYNKIGWLLEQSYISGVSMLRLLLVRANSTLFSPPQNYLPSPATHTLLRADGAGQGCQGRRMPVGIRLLFHVMVCTSGLREPSWPGGR